MLRVGQRQILRLSMGKRWRRSMNNMLLDTQPQPLTSFVLIVVSARRCSFMGPIHKRFFSSTVDQPHSSRLWVRLGRSFDHNKAVTHLLAWMCCRAHMVHDKWSFTWALRTPSPPSLLLLLLLFNFNQVNTGHWLLTETETIGIASHVSTLFSPTCTFVCLICTSSLYTDSFILIFIRFFQEQGGGTSPSDSLFLSTRVCLAQRKFDF